MFCDLLQVILLTEQRPGCTVTKEDMQGIALICPLAPFVERATKYFEPIHSELGELTKQIKILRLTRDLLMSRLLSGQIVMNND